MGNLYVNKKNNFQQAFTVVELIIVVLVISILVTLSVVAYNGIQQKARETALLSDLDNAISILEHDLSANGVYPDTVELADGGRGLPTDSGTTYQYIVGTNVSSPTFCLTATNSSQSYTISQDGPSVPGRCNLLQNSSIEKTGGGEFMQYADLAPIFDKYGMVQYTVSFDIKSANIGTRNTILAYMQNGSATKYSFVGTWVPVTTSYVRQSLTATPAISTATETRAMLAFYGVYGTGNIPSVKNVKIEFGNTASDWTPAP